MSCVAYEALTEASYPTFIASSGSEGIDDRREYTLLRFQAEPYRRCRILLCDVSLTAGARLGTLSASCGGAIPLLITTCEGASE